MKRLSRRPCYVNRYGSFTLSLDSMKPWIINTYSVRYLIPFFNNFSPAFKLFILASSFPPRDVCIWNVTNSILQISRATGTIAICNAISASFPFFFYARLFENNFHPGADEMLNEHATIPTGIRVLSVKQSEAVRAHSFLPSALVWTEARLNFDR